MSTTLSQLRDSVSDFVHLWQDNRGGDNRVLASGRLRVNSRLRISALRRRLVVLHGRLYPVNIERIRFSRCAKLASATAAMCASTKANVTLSGTLCRSSSASTARSASDDARKRSSLVLASVDNEASHHRRSQERQEQYYHCSSSGAVSEVAC